MKHTLGTFIKGKKIGNRKKGYYTMLSGRLKQINNDRKKVESELADKINRLCDFIESKNLNSKK